jgi:50S ribosomal protein L16 3-hydroxylase
MQLVGLDIEQFLFEHWQKRPLLIRNPWDAWRNPLEPDELAGLACEEGIESRLVTLEGARLAVETGPFPEARFGALNDGPWTLLVQAVNHYVGDVAALVAPFRFVPDWRIDDVMVSYATDGAGVGPHFDQYDVFLIQGLGKRRWRVGPRCHSATPLLPHEDLRLLADFDATEEWTLEPGDILYVPPLFAHEGVAIGDDCMTYSIGFRAPSCAELVDGWCEHQADALSEDERYADPDLMAQEHPGEITPSAIDRLYAMTMAALSDRAGFARWFGLHNSLPKYPEDDMRPEQPIDQAMVREVLARGEPLYRNPASRFSFIRQETAILLFADGHCFECSGDTATLGEKLCSGSVLRLDADLARSAPALVLITALMNQGSLAFDGWD